MDMLRSVKFRSGHTLTTWDTGRTTRDAKVRLRYEFRDSAADWARRECVAHRSAGCDCPPAYRTADGAVLFEGEDFGVSPLHASDSDAALLAMLGFLTLRPGDTDSEYFEDYTRQQMHWAQSCACEGLACSVSVAEEAGGCACGYVWENLPTGGEVRACEDAPAIGEFEVLDHGEDGSQYFPGCGVYGSRFEHVVTGVGDTAAEALEDALESMASGEPDATVSPLQERAMRDALSEPDKSAFESLDHSECGDPDESEHDWYHYVSVRYNRKGT